MEQAILQFFEGIRASALTPVFATLTFFGEGLTVGGIVLVLYWLIGGKTGEQLLCTVLTSSAFGAHLKEAVHRTRPYAAGVVERLDVDNFLVSTRDLGDNLSFPSGHALSSSAALTAGSLRSRKWWVFVLCALLEAGIICSRLYFGVHYPTDLLCGLLFGVLIALFWHFVFCRLYAFRYYVLAGMALIAMVILPIFPYSDNVHMTALLAGGAFFLPLTSFLKYDPPKSFLRRLIRIPVGLCCAGAVYALTMLFPEGAGFSLLKWFLLFGAGTLLATWLFRLLKI